MGVFVPAWLVLPWCEAAIEVCLICVSSTYPEGVKIRPLKLGRGRSVRNPCFTVLHECHPLNLGGEDSTSILGGTGSQGVRLQMRVCLVCVISTLSGPVLRGTARLSQRYCALWGFGVST